MKGKTWIALLLAAALLGLTACAGTETPAQESAASTETPKQTEPVSVPFALPLSLGDSLHPLTCDDRANLTLMPLLYEGLFELDGTFSAQPVLCQSWQSDESGLVWTFTLRTDVTFSNGTPLTAQHAADALTAAMAAGSRYAGRLAQVERVSAQEQVLTVTLRTPNGALPTLLDIPIYLERDGRWFGTGPYIMAGTEEEPFLQAREGWWRGQELPARQIPLTPAETLDDLIHAFDTWEASLVVTDLTGTSTPSYSTSYEVWDYPTTSMIYLIFNTRTGHCDQQALRQALARGIDRASITNSLFARRVTQALLPVSPASPLYDESLGESLTYDLEELDRLLIGVRMRPLTLLVNQENSFKAAAADFLAEQWNGAGLEVTVEKLDWEDYTAALERGNFDLCLAEVSLRPDFDLTELLAAAGSLNYGGWSSGETDALLSAFRSAQGDEARRTASEKLYAHLAEQVPLVPVCFKNHSVLTQWQQITGLTPTASNVFYGMNWSLPQ